MDVVCELKMHYGNLRYSAKAAREFRWPAWMIAPLLVAGFATGVYVGATAAGGDSVSQYGLVAGYFPL